jgi:Ca2+-binding RTX toxin-like protein
LTRHRLTPFLELLESRLVLSHLLDGDGVLVVELGDSDDVVRLDPVAADTVRLTINGESDDYSRDSVARIAVTAGGGSDRVEISTLLDIPAVVSGGDGDDTLLGGAAADTLHGDGGSDSLAGDDDDDELFIDLLDSFDTGPGIDRLAVQLAGTDDPDIVRLEYVDDTTTRLTVNGTTYDFDRYELSAAEITAGDGDDSVEVTADVRVDAVIFGGAGNDRLLSGAGADQLDGGSGVDSIAGRGGMDSIAAEYTDVVSGGNGDDSISLLVVAGADADLIRVENLDPVTVRLTVSGVFFDYDRTDLKAIEVQAGAGNDLVEFMSDVQVSAALFGGDGDDTLQGAAGSDALDGGLGNDLISGGDGQDTLSGAAGLDTMDGAAGDDLIDGGEDDDSLIGGDGADTLWGDNGADTISGGAGADEISGGLPRGYATDLVDGGDCSGADRTTTRSSPPPARISSMASPATTCSKAASATIRWRVATASIHFWAARTTTRSPAAPETTR